MLVIWNGELDLGLVPYLGTSQHDFPGDEYEEHDLRFDHAVDQTREQLMMMHRHNSGRLCSVKRLHRSPIPKIA